MKLAIDAMSGDLGAKPVVEAVKKFTEEFKNIELKVVGKEEELSAVSYTHLTLPTKA